MQTFFNKDIVVGVSIKKNKHKIDIHLPICNQPFAWMLNILYLIFL